MGHAAADFAGIWQGALPFADGRLTMKCRPCRNPSGERSPFTRLAMRLSRVSWACRSRPPPSSRGKIGEAASITTGTAKRDHDFKVSDQAHRRVEKVILVTLTGQAAQNLAAPGSWSLGARTGDRSDPHLVQATSTRTYSRDHPAQRVAHAAVAHEGHDFAIPVTFGTLEPITVVWTDQVATRCSPRETLIRTCCPSIAASRQQGAAREFISFSGAERSDKLAEHPQEL